MMVSLTPVALFRSHPFARFLFASGLTGLAISSQSVLLSLLITLLAAVLIRFIDGTWLTLMRMARLLSWFIIPILLLHALFSPGQLLLPSTGLAVTVEGLLQGVQLSSRLLAMFVSAMLMFRMLSYTEWLTAIVAVPILGGKLLPFVWMIHPMQQQVRQRLGLMQQQYRLRREWRMLPQILLGACYQSLIVSSQVARSVWLRWPQQVVTHRSLSEQYDYPLSLLLAIIGIACLLLAWV
ncbi:MAG: hypothetical protein R8K50_06115 [Mariprofundus sp.]